MINSIKNKVYKYIITNKLFLSFLLLAIIETIFLRLFTVKLSFDIRPFLTDLGIILLLGSIGYYFKPKNQFKYYITIIIIISLMCIINSIYYTFYTSFASFGELATVAQVETVTGAVVEKLRFVDLIYIVFPFIFFIRHLNLLKSNYYYLIEKIEKNKKMFVGTLLFGVILVCFSFGTAKSSDYSRLAKQWNRVYIVERFGITLYQFNDLVQSITPRFSSMFGYEEAVDKFNLYYEEKNNIPKNKYTGLLNGYNVVFVHMESIQNFLMDVKVNDKELTPNLNKLAKEGMFFSNFYPQVSTGTSSDAEFIINTGLMPAQSGTIFVSYNNREYFTIPKILKEKGYYTFSMHGNFDSMWNRSKVHPLFGYDEMYFKEKFIYEDEDVINLGINDKLFFQQAVSYLEQIDKTYNNYAGTVITLSNHTPFSKAAEHSEFDFTIDLNSVDEETGKNIIKKVDFVSNTTVGEYMLSSNYADEALGEFLDLIKKSDYFDNTIFVFYGDHDAKLSKHEINNWLNLNQETGEIYTVENENYVLYDTYKHELNKKTPLILWSKNKNAASILKGEIKYTMGMYDVAPTLYNMFGIYNKYTVGNDIFTVKNDNMVVFPNGNILTNDFYYRNSTEEYVPFDSNKKLSEDKLKEIKKVAEEKIEVSNYIVVYDLLKNKSLTGD